MSSTFFRRTELDRTTYPDWRDGILADEGQPAPPRRYPSYPTHALPRLRPRLWPSLDRVMRQRRSGRDLSAVLPDRRTLARVLSAHAITGPDTRGPTPSAGGLQGLELYLGVLTAGWVPTGLYHLDRAGWQLARLGETSRAELEAILPSLQLESGGAVVWIVVGDGARVQARYGERGLRFLLLEAGHLMQSLCLLSASVGLTTIPLGGYFEADLARRLHLAATDEVLYLGLCGAQG